MPGDKRYTAYCGLYCADCIPSKGELFSTVNELERLLEQLHVGQYAAIKSETNAVFKGFDTFMEMLRAIKGLESSAPCREGCKPDCRIVRCAVGKGYEGCWQCNQNMECDKLERLKRIHPCLRDHLQLLAGEDLDNWSGKRGRHYTWL